MDFEVDVSGVKDLQGRLTRLKASLLDWSSAMRAVGQSFKEYYSTVPFASRGSVFGDTWPDLNPAYKSQKAKKYPGRPILVRTGAMQKGFNFTSTRDSIRLGNQVKYFAKHQEGDGVPQRIMLALNDERVRAASDILRDDLIKKVDNA